MGDERLIRLENLRLLKLDARALQAKLGSSYPFWRELLLGQKSFGEKLARRIEAALGLPNRWLDTPQGAAPEAALFRDLDPFESQLITLFRQMGPDTQHDTLIELNNRVAPKATQPSIANPFKKNTTATKEKGLGIVKSSESKRRFANLSAHVAKKKDHR